MADQIVRLIVPNVFTTHRPNSGTEKKSIDTDFGTIFIYAEVKR